MTLDLTTIRNYFPALDNEAVFLDNPGGTQIAQHSIDRINDYLVHHNANFHGVFKTSRESDAIIDQARSAVSDFLNASTPSEIIFGPNMTSLTFNLSRSLAQTWKPGDEIIVTRLDHDANITPWVMAAEERDCRVQYLDFNPGDGILNIEDLESLLQGRPRLVAVAYASNALGTVNPLKKIISMAHQAGALVYVDAVQYAPHGPIDVQDLDCDFLVCSFYKVFGPHVGALYGRYELLDRMKAYKVRPASSSPPEKFETGTKNHEGIAGVLGALEYLEWLGSEFGGDDIGRGEGRYTGRKLALKRAMNAIRAYEYETSRLLLDILAETPGVTVYGPHDSRNLERRIPTFSFTLDGWHPRRVAQELDRSNIYVWSGNYYALAVTERLGLEESGGMVRVGPVHYNTIEEIYSFGESLGKIAVGVV